MGCFKMPCSDFGPAPIELTSGLTTPSVKLLTTVVNAAPMTTATDRSTILPRARNSLNPLSISECPFLDWTEFAIDHLPKRGQVTQCRVSVTVWPSAEPATVFATRAGSATKTTRSTSLDERFSFADTSTTTASVAITLLTAGVGG